MSLIVGLIVILLLVAANGFFVAVEFALVAADRQKLDSLATDGSRMARAAISARRRLSFHLSGAQLGITVTSLVIGQLTESTVGQWLSPILDPIGFPSGSTGSIIIALGVATVFQMVVGELIPKTIAVAKPEATSLILAPVALVVHGALSPMIRMFNGVANWTVRRLGMEPQEELADLRSLEELEYLIQTSGESGTIGADAWTLLTRTIRFGDKTAADVLTPRVHVLALPDRAPVDDLIANVRHSRFSRFPVYGNDLDDIRGVVEVTSVFALDQEQRAELTAADLMVEPLVVPETRDLVDIVADFRTAETQMAVVIDEHGGTAGILTLEDVLEEIVGEVDDEYDQASDLTVGVEPGVFLVAGTLHPDEVEEACGFVMPEGEYETIAGFVLAELGRIPEVEDSVTRDGWEIQVAAMDRLRIASLRMMAPTPTSVTPSEAEK